LQKRSIGSLEVTVVGIGCNNFGRQLDAAATAGVVHAALDAGINFFDTADSYGMPKTMSETLLGPLLRPHRDRVVIATKFGRALDEAHRGAKPAYVKAATEASLKRLQTDHIDLMQLHIPDPTTPIEDTLGALADLIREGKVREIGVSNVEADELRRMTETARAHHLPSFATIQMEYSLLYRAPVANILAECERSGVKFVPFRPLFNGLLTGKYRPGAPAAAGSRIGGKSAQAQAEILSPENLAMVDALTRYAEGRGRSPLELAFGWLLAHAVVPSIIAGVSSPNQVAANAAATGWQLTEAEMAEVARLLKSGGAFTA
jgi:aryl-alcohol dehydrogenase-like predicted oxidoreductase